MLFGKLLCSRYTLYQLESWQERGGALSKGRIWGALNEGCAHYLCLSDVPLVPLPRVSCIDGPCPWFPGGIGQWGALAGFGKEGARSRGNCFSGSPSLLSWHCTLQLTAPTRGPCIPPSADCALLGLGSTFPLFPSGLWVVTTPWQLPRVT